MYTQLIHSTVNLRMHIPRHLPQHFKFFLIQSYGNEKRTSKSLLNH